MKTIKQFREEYDNVVLTQTAPDELMLEGRESSVIKSVEKTIPSPSHMPTMLMFRRVAYRQYPGKQVVALYYSKLVNKYLSIPFGPDGNLNLSEAVVEEGAGLEAIKGGLKGAAKGAFKGHLFGAAVAGGPGAALGTVAGGAVGAYKGAKKAYNKAKEQNMEEDWSDTKHQSPTGGLKKSGVMAYRRENPGSKLQTAVTTKPSKLKKGSKAANRRKSFCARMGGMKKRLTSAKTARDPDSRINKALRKWNCEESFRSRLSQLRESRVDENIVGAVGGWLASKAMDFISPKATPSSSSSSDSAFQRYRGATPKAKPTTKTKSTWEKAKPADDTFVSRQKAAMAKELSSSSRKQVAENKISDIRTMIESNNSTHEMNINGRTITLNNSMAKRILEVYDSVNTKNKKIVESMLNEDLESFKKLLNFSIKA
jgi:hypothetical protein